MQQWNTEYNATQMDAFFNLKGCQLLVEVLIHSIYGPL